MLEHNINQCIFSSSCTVYGSPESLPMTEEHRQKPISPYGKTKQVTDIAHAYLLALNYLESNAASDCFNLGTGTEVSIKKLIRITEQLFNIPSQINFTQRRISDPAHLIADACKDGRILG